MRKMILFIALIVLPVSGCLTEGVHEIGHVSEQPEGLKSVSYDDQGQVLEVVYRASLVDQCLFANHKETLTVERKLTIPYDHLGLFELCDIRDLDASKVESRWDNARKHCPIGAGPKGELRYGGTLQPESVLDTTYVATCVSETSVHVDISDLEYYDSLSRSYRTRDSEFAEVVKGGQVAQFTNGEFLIPWHDKVILVRVPEREARRPGTVLKRVTLYPFAVAGDILLLPVYVAGGLVTGLVLAIVSPG